MRVKQQTAERHEFVASALTARRNFKRTGEAYGLDDVCKYLAARIAGKPAREPRAKRWRA